VRHLHSCGVLLYGRDSEGTEAAGPTVVETLDFSNVHDLFLVRNMFFYSNY